MAATLAFALRKRQCADGSAPPLDHMDEGEVSAGQTTVLRSRTR